MNSLKPIKSAATRNRPKWSKRLAVDLNVDMNARNVRMILYCAEKKKIDMEKKENNDIEKKEKGKNEQVESTG